VRTAVRVCLGLLSIAFVVLGATGAWLWFRYQPGVGWIGDVHQVAAIAFVVLAVVVVVLAIARRLRDSVRGPLASLALLVAAVAAGLVGRLLPWDQLALWAVTTGSNGEFDGVRAVFSSQAKFVIINGREVSPSTYEFWAYAHLGLAVLVGVALTLVWLRTKERGPVAPPAPEGELVRSS
jgi:quinol-cytochrome oxidoreductase complex cytochrome b subunit